MEKPQSLVTWADHNKSTTIGVFIALIICAVLGSCQFKADSIMTPGKRVTRAELEIEVFEAQKQYEQEIAEAGDRYEIKTGKAELGFEAINKKDAMLKKAIETGGALAKLAIKGTLDPGTGFAAALTLLGGTALVGVGFDNRKKNKIIAKAKNGNVNTDSA